MDVVEFVVASCSCSEVIERLGEWGRNVEMTCVEGARTAHDRGDTRMEKVAGLERKIQLTIFCFVYYPYCMVPIAW